MKISFMFRRPKFPVILNLDGVVIGARSPRSLEKALLKAGLDPAKVYEMVDSTGEGWCLYTEQMIISPLTVKNRWFKKEVIGLYNNRKNAPEQDVKYSEKSISSKRFDRIVNQIVDLLEK